MFVGHRMITPPRRVLISNIAEPCSFLCPPNVFILYSMAIILIIPLVKYPIVRLSL